MAGHAEQSNPLSSDIHKPLTNTQVYPGWETGREHDYWIPAADIDGEIPQQLRGTLLRNGPGISEVYGNKLVQPIDGDGMVVALTFLDGKVHLRCRFVETEHRLHEQKEKKLLYRGPMGTYPNSALVDSLKFIANMMTFRWPKIKWRNPSNTNVFYWGGKIISVYETALPYCLDPYTLNTLGKDDLGGCIQLSALAAHFRLDMIKKRFVSISVRPGLSSLKPSLYVYEFDQNWRLVQQQLHHIEGLNYAHDFLLLPDYYVFHMTPFVSSTLQDAIKVYMGLTAPGRLVRHYSSLPSRFVVVPRHKEAHYQEIMMFDVEPLHIFHFGTAEQRGDSIMFNAVCYGPKFKINYDVDQWLSNAMVSPGRMRSFTLDLAQRVCHTTPQPADPASVEFPCVHPYRHGHLNTRYAYLMASDRKGHNLPYRDIVKFDTQEKDRQVWYSHGCVGEPVFVPRLGWESWCHGEEDDGYVLAQLYVPQTHTTQFVVLDAQHMDQGPLATIKLKHHIPYGFHGTFTPEVFLPGQGEAPVIKAKL